MRALRTPSIRRPYKGSVWGGTKAAVWGLSILTLVFGFALVGCGGDDGGDNGKKSGGGGVTVTVTAAGDATSVARGGTLKFTASVTGVSLDPADRNAQLFWAISTEGIDSRTTMETTTADPLNATLEVAIKETKPSIEVEAIVRDLSYNDIASAKRIVTVTAPLPPTAQTLNGTQWREEDYDSSAGSVEFTSEGIKFLHWRTGSQWVHWASVDSSLFGSATETASGSEVYTVTFTGTLTNAIGSGLTFDQFKTDFSGSGALTVTNWDQPVTFNFNLSYKDETINLDNVVFERSYY